MGLEGDWERIAFLREAVKSGRDPVCADETLRLLMETARKVHAQNILEIGTGEGLTSVALALRAGISVTTIENDPARIQRARENFLRFGVEENVTLLEGDAGEILPSLTGEFDLIFLDGPKVQYRKYFPDCKRLLKRGGALVSDDVFFLGRDIDAVPKKRRMLFLHLREYRELLESDPEFETEYYEFGEGVAVSIKG